MSRLGLRRNAVTIVEHRPEWLSTFQIEASALWRCLGDLVVDVQHIGSTAIAGVPAKPILDIAIALRTRDMIPTIVERLRQRGYIDRGDAGAQGGYVAPQLRSTLSRRDRDDAVSVAHAPASARSATSSRNDGSIDR